MTRDVVISGLGPISGLGIGLESTWQAALAGQSAVARVQAFDPSGFDSQLGCEVPAYKIGDYVPKSYRKATKVMARDIELAVIGADKAARDAGLLTRGTDPDAAKNDDFQPTYPPIRVGCHIGAGLIAAEVDELTAALVEARAADGSFDIHKWGNEGMTHLTPLWLLKYLPNMLACHVTIIHDAQGPSNTITCAEASAGLSVGESLRVIQRDDADACFCGGTDSKINPAAFYRQQLTDRLTTHNDQPHTAIRPFDRNATGCAVGEGGAIVILEAKETCLKRGGRIYAQVLGFGASQTVNREAGNLKPDPHGQGMFNAMRAALKEADVEPGMIDLVVPFGLGHPDWDAAEAAALRALFGDRLATLPVLSIKALVGNCGAGAGGLEVAIAAKALHEQTIPAIINRDQPLEGLSGQSLESRQTTLRHALVFSTGLGGQNTALVLGAK